MCIRDRAHAAPTVVRTVQQPAAVSHRHHTSVHNEPTTVIRTVPHAFHNVVAQPTVVRTVATPAVHLAHAAPVQRTIVRTIPTPTYHHVEEVEVEASPNYSFGYSVADVRSGDAKTREESRDGDVVRGSYTVADPDGRLRRVTYTADKINGFQATVTYDGKPGPVAIPIDAPQQQASVVAPAEDSFVVTRSQEEDDDDASVAQTHLVHTASPSFIRLANGQLAHSNNLGHGQFVRVTNANRVFASSPFGVRALPTNTHFVANNGGFVRSIPHLNPAGTTVVSHA